jgi:hypothetical protein
MNPALNRLQPEDCPPGANKHARTYFASILRRLDYLSASIRLKSNRYPEGQDWRLQEFDALTWLLSLVVGQELVDRWMVKYEVAVPLYPANGPARASKAATGGVD